MRLLSRLLGTLICSCSPPNREVPPSLTSYHYFKFPFKSAHHALGGPHRPPGRCVPKPRSSFLISSIVEISSAPHQHLQRPPSYSPTTHRNTLFSNLLPADLGRRQTKLSALAKFVMNGQFGQNPSQPSPKSLSPSAAEFDHHLAVLPPPARDDVNPTSHPQQLAHQPHMAPSPLPSALRAISDLTDTPSNPRSLNSTAPSSPRM